MAITKKTARMAAKKTENKKKGAPLKTGKRVACGDCKGCNRKACKKCKKCTGNPRKRCIERQCTNIRRVEVEDDKKNGKGVKKGSAKSTASEKKKGGKKMKATSEDVENGNAKKASTTAVGLMGGGGDPSNRTSDYYSALLTTPLDPAVATRQQRVLSKLNPPIDCFDIFGRTGHSSSSESRAVLIQLQLRQALLEKLLQLQLRQALLEKQQQTSFAGGSNMNGSPNQQQGWGFCGQEMPLDDGMQRNMTDASNFRDEVLRLLPDKFPEFMELVNRIGVDPPLECLAHARRLLGGYDHLVLGFASFLPSNSESNPTDGEVIAEGEKGMELENLSDDNWGDDRYDPGGDDFANNGLDGDDDGEVQLTKNDNIPREDWEHVPGMTRQSLLKLICGDPSAGEEMVAVQIDHRGDTSKEDLKHFFLVVSRIISNGTYEGRSIPADAVFVLQKVDGIISMYDSTGKQVGDDRTSWDIYAQALSDNGSASVGFYAVEGQSGSIGRFEGGVHKWHWLLHHMEQDRIGRANGSRLLQSITIRPEALTDDGFTTDALLAEAARRNIEATKSTKTGDDMRMVDSSNDENWGNTNNGDLERSMGFYAHVPKRKKTSREDRRRAMEFYANLPKRKKHRVRVADR